MCIRDSGYTDNAVRMLMIGYLYSKEMGFNILLPDLYGHGMLSLIHSSTEAPTEVTEDEEAMSSCGVTATTAVSYTHLDVYKRQPYSIS